MGCSMVSVTFPFAAGKISDGQWPLGIRWRLVHYLVAAANLDSHGVLFHGFSRYLRKKINEGEL